MSAYNLLKIIRQADALVTSLEIAHREEKEIIAKGALEVALRCAKQAAALVRVPE